MLLRSVIFALLIVLCPGSGFGAVGPFSAPVLNEFLLDINQKRAARRLAPLQAPTPVQSVELERLFVRSQAQQGTPQFADAEVRRLFPNAGRFAWLARSFASTPRTADLAALLQPAKGTASGVDWFSAEFTHAAFALVPQKTGPGWMLFALGYELVPDYDTTLLHAGQRTFFFECPQCRKRFPSVLRGELSQSVRCPADGLKIAEFARDSTAHLDHLCFFLQPFKPEDLRAKTPAPRLEELCAEIWLRCLGAITYRRDGKQDTWSRAPETWKAQMGDCEDSSVLLAGWLRAEGIPARVALGFMAEKPLDPAVLAAATAYPGRRTDDGHAWVVLRADGEDYIMESTKRHLNRRVPPLARLEPRYWPETQVTPDALLTRRQSGWTSDYGDPSLWLTIPKR